MKSDELLFNEAKALHIKGEIKDAQDIYLQLLKKIQTTVIYYFYLEPHMYNKKISKKEKNT